MLPEALCGVASLEELNLGNNDIGSLPHGLLHLARLRRLAIDDNPRLAAEHEIVGNSWDAQDNPKDNDVGALFAHLRSVHGGEPPPLEGQAPVYREMREGDAEALGLADKALPAGTPICVAVQGRGEYVSFNKKTFGANEHTIRLDAGGFGAGSLPGAHVV